MTSRRSGLAAVLAVLVAVVVLWRVVVPRLDLLVRPGDVAADPVTRVPTVVLVLAGIALVAAAAAMVLDTPTAAAWFGRALVGYLVVMAGYLVLGLALGESVPWTAYAVLVAVALLGSAARTADR